MTEPRPCTVDNRHNLADDEPHVCRACIGRTRADLHAITNSYALLPTLMAELALSSNAPRRDAHRSNERPLLGGAPLVFLSGGGNAANALRRSLHAERRPQQTGNHPWRNPSHVEPEFGADDAPGDPESVGWALGSIEDDWRRAMGIPAAEHGYLVAPAAAFLHLHLQWAANRHPGFPDFAEDIRNLRWALEHATGQADIPVKAEAPCLDCGGDLIRRYRDVQHAGTKHQTGGLEEDWTCRRCKRQYTDPEYRLACADQADTDPAAGPWSPLAVVAADLGIPYRTVQTWARRGRLASRTHPVTGLLEARINQARRLTEQRRNTAG